MEIILTVLSVLVQCAIVTYSTLLLAKLFKRSQFSKYDLGFTILLSIFSVISCSIVRNIFPLSNTLLALILLYVNFNVILKLKPAVSALLSILEFILSVIPEILAFLLINILFKKSSDMVSSSYILLLVIYSIQLVSIIVTTKLLKKLLQKYTRITTLIENITPKQTYIFLILLCIGICPQLIMLIFNKFSYPMYFLLINCLQITIIACVIFTYINKSLEKNKAESDLITTKMHNDTMSGMIDGIKILKHDYNNIIQALNGYVATKQYDKLQEHINKVLKECNVVNNLAVIDPEIFNEPAIYGIVGAKYFLITEKDITMDLDIMTNIKEINFPIPELSRILGILLDNAKEATLNAPNPYVRLEMRFDKRKCADIIRVINTYDTNISINLNEIYKKGVSSKKVKSGIGLWEVKKIVSKIPHAQIFPDIEKDKFVQTLIIEKNI